MEILTLVLGLLLSPVLNYFVYRRRRIVSAMLIREDLYALQDQIAGDTLPDGVFLFDRITMQMRHTDEDLVRFAARGQPGRMAQTVLAAAPERRCARWVLRTGWLPLPPQEWKNLCRVLRHGRAYIAQETAARQALPAKDSGLLWKLYHDCDSSRKALHRLDGLGEDSHHHYKRVEARLCLK